MRYRLLGNSGLRVSEAALGTMTFGDDWGWGAAKDEARKLYDAFREAGGNFIDTANLYTNGTSESFLGEFMQGHRQSVVMATKYTNAAPGKDPNAAGNHRKSMMQAIEASLKRLRTDYIDLYWVHIWDQITPVEEVMRGQDNLASFDLTLPADQLKTLDEASRIELGFPHDFYNRELVRAIAYGGMRDHLLV